MNYVMDRSVTKTCMYKNYKVYTEYTVLDLFTLKTYDFNLVSFAFLQCRYSSIALSLSSSKSCFLFRPRVAVFLTAFGTPENPLALLSLSCRSKVVPCRGFFQHLGLAVSCGGAGATSPKRTLSENTKQYS